MIKIYNTLTRKKEEFVPLVPGEVKMYACGITVYDECHLGHAMQAIFFDTIRRYFEYSGFKVKYVRNYTDIDDKIIARANSLGIKPLELSEYYIEDSKKDMAALKVMPATFEPKVSQHIPDIINFVQKLIDKKYAYVSDGNVFFRVSSFPEYGKLSNRKLEEMEPDPDTSQGKQSPHDFALWKAAKPNEPFWESPWGKGRPGWHIECSTMANYYLGETLDIHGGGMDIAFPHHENEIAQSEAANGSKFANYWIHNGLLMVENKKMSKSLGNFITIKQALSQYQADVIRYMILSFSISSNVNFTSENLAAINKNVYSYYQTLLKINEILSSNSSNQEKESGIDVIDNIEKIFRENMDDFFNSAAFLANFSELFKSLNKILSSNKTLEEKSAIFRRFMKNFKPITKVLGILDENPKEYLERFTQQYIANNNIDISEVEQKIKERDIARKNKNFKEADRIREELLKKGIALHDTPSGTKWSVIL